MLKVNAPDLLQQLEALTADDLAPLSASQKARLGAAARSVSLAVETPADAVSRVLLTQPVEEVTVRIAADLRLFSALGNSTLTTAELAKATGAEPQLLERVLRNLAAYGAIKEYGSSKYAASPSYALYNDPVFEDAFGKCQDILNKIRQALPEFLASTQYKNPSEPNDTAVQYAYGTKGKGFMESIMADPTSAANLQCFVILMSVWAEGFVQIGDVYPVKERLQNGFDPETAMFVDVGGGHGQKAVGLKKSFPDIPGRFVVQDVLGIIETAPKDAERYKGIELTAHDFFTEQPVKEARCYYIRQCLHNWTDEKCVAILQQLQKAGRPGYSRILRHEIITPETGAGPWIASQDLNMMSFCAVGERTEAEWRSVAAKAGLNVSRVYLNDDASREGILEINL